MERRRAREGEFIVGCFGIVEEDGDEGCLDC